MKIKAIKLLSLFSILAFSLMITACSDDTNSAEDVGRNIDGAVEDAGENLEEAKKEAANLIEDAADELEEGADELERKANE